MIDKRAIATTVVKKLRSRGFDAYFAGGCVRDDLLGITPSDFDVASSATPEEVISLFTKTVPVGAAFGVVLVIEEGVQVEVATFRTEGGYQDGRRPTHVQFATVEEDAARRDFTVNGLYSSPGSSEVLDFVGGRRDLKRRIIRTIGNADDRFSEDRLRMLRAIRFAVQLDFEIDPDTFEAIKRHADKILQVSWERIRDEWTKIITSSTPAKGLRLLDECGLLRLLFPEIEAMKGVEQPAQYHPEGDVFVHTMMLMDQLSSPCFELAMGALFHDVAKPNTFERAADRIRFHGHDSIGAEMTEAICRRLVVPNEPMKLIRELVKQHLRFKDAFDMKKSTLKRFFSLPRFDLHLELHRIDCLASHGKLDAYHFCREKIREFESEPPPPLKLVTGEDLKQMGYAPGPRYASILTEVEDQVLEGSIADREQALAYIRKHFGEKNAPSSGRKSNRES